LEFSETPLKPMVAIDSVEGDDLIGTTAHVEHSMGPLEIVQPGTDLEEFLLRFDRRARPPVWHVVDGFRVK